MSHLQNKHILLTRPARQSAGLQQELEKRQAIVYVAPLIRTESINPEGTRLVISKLEDFDWLVFTSANGVDYFCQHFRRMRASMPERMQIAVIGSATAAAVKQCNWKISLVPETASSEGLIQALGQLDLTGKRFGLFLAEKTRDLLRGALSRMGARITEVPLYRTTPDPGGIAVLQVAPWSEIDAVVFMSGSAAEVFASKRPVEAVRSPLKYCAVGPATAQRMRELGLSVDWMAADASTDGIIQALERAFAQETQGGESISA
ncbi:MAG: uroporphyrinogen-III synthase [Acidobacteria bacterium]|nr:uroporphyrinogen-III synthase [Acidobacteriota bacterium]